MQEYKFKAWDTKNNRWLTPDEIEKRLMLNPSIVEWGSFFIQQADSTAAFDDIELIIGFKLGNQYIYIGDIFNLGDKNILYVVEWIDAGFKGRQIGNQSLVGLEYWKDNIEIVGNRFANPNLIAG